MCKRYLHPSAFLALPCDLKSEPRAAPVSDWPCLIRSDPHVCPRLPLPTQIKPGSQNTPSSSSFLGIASGFTKSAPPRPPPPPNVVSTKEKWGLHHAGEFLLRGLLQLADSALVSEAQKGKQGAFEGGTTEVVLIQSSKTAEDIPRDSH